MVRAGLTTERLTRAGAELADEVGFEQVTVSELARRFDVKVASLYSHVRNSQDLKTRIALLALRTTAWSSQSRTRTRREVSRASVIGRAPGGSR
ncbi:TetR family transcriptional regulator, partial [Streptomyces sp. NPDC005568]|uniref:TetR family transcriptional regulator n=1 Tax=Streptomyces sp. NPDC005568 TaxID=3156887 RepID=UPI00339E8AB3